MEVLVLQVLVEVQGLAVVLEVQEVLAQVVVLVRQEQVVLMVVQERLVQVAHLVLQEVVVVLVLLEHQVQVALQEVVEVQESQGLVVLQELLAQVDYQETTLLTQVDGVMRQVEGPLLPQGLVPIVQQFLQ
jgi:hypothetical protein